MEESPFVTHGPWPPATMQGRADLIADLVERVSRRRVTALVGPRRYGKTSVLQRVAADLTEVSSVYIDLWGVASSADVARAFDDALAKTSGRMRRRVDDTAISLGLNVGGVGLSIARPARDRPDYDGLIPSLLSVITGAAEQVPTLLIIDEFSAADRVPHALARLRTGLQHHYRNLGLLFAGSEPSTMQMLFADRAQPFYAQADLLAIGPLSLADATAIITDGFVSTGRGAGALPALAMDLTGGHPHRTMQLADAVWRATPTDTTVQPEHYRMGLDQVRREVIDGLQRFFISLPLGHQRVLRLVANGHPPHGAKGEVIDLTPGSATHARDALLANGDLINPDGRVALTDPLLADFLRTTLPF
jgi:hypothetical protein